MSNANFAVLGMGVIGMNTALELQKQYPNVKVDVISEKFEQDTTSNVAAGLFITTCGFCGPNRETEYKWLKNSYDHWLNLARQNQPFITGISTTTGFNLSNESLERVKVDSLKNILPTYKFLENDELEIYNSKWRYGLYLETLIMENKLFLPWAREQFLQNGGRIIKKRINSFNELEQLKYDIIMNCTGLGSKYLCNDEQLIPLRGQVLKVKAPWVNNYVCVEEETYVIPGITQCTLGISHDYGHFNLKVCPYQSQAIKENCEKLIPSLKNAELIKEMVGLRPLRSPIRVESEIVTNHQNGKILKIVHNYGHGGCGVTTAPGTSKHSIELIKDLFFIKQKL